MADTPTQRTPVLVVDGTPELARLRERLDTGELELVEVGSPEEARSQMATRTFAGVLVDAGRYAALLADAQHARREAEQLRLLVHGTTDYAIFMLDPQGHVQSWNPGAERLKGFTAEDIVGRHFSTFYPQEAIDRGWPAHELEVAAREGRFEDEGWRVRKDGSQFWANVIITALRDEQGTLVGFSKITRDLTARKQAEEAARLLAEESAARRAAERNAEIVEEQRQRLHVTLASIGDGVISTDREGRVDFLNGVAEGLVGWTNAEAVGRPLEEVFQIVNEDTRRRVDNPALRALAEGVIVGLANHTVLIARDGSERPIDDSAAPIWDTSGKVIGSVLVFRDISGRRRVERQRSVRAAATLALTEATTVDEAAEGVLAAMGNNLGWDAALLWMVDEERQELLCRHTWQRDAQTTALIDASCARSFTQGQGLPGRVWASGTPAWILDVTGDPNFPRAPAARESGIASAFACPLLVGDRFLGVIELFARRMEAPDTGLLEMATTVAGGVGQFLERRRAENELREQTQNAEALVRVGNLLAVETDLQRLVQVVTDEATRLCGAQFGAFFYNVVSEAGEAYTLYTLYTLSGVPREAFAKFPMPRNTAVFGPTFHGDTVVRSADITQDPRYGKNAPYHGMPEGHLPVRSYLAVPVISRTGEVLGGLFFGHAEPGVFSARHERLLTSVAGQAAVAVDNVRLYQRTQATAERLELALSAADLGAWSWDSTTDVVTFSERAAAIFGVSLDQPITWTGLQELLHPVDRLRARGEVERVIAERVQYDIEYRVNRPDGQEVWVGALGRGVYGDGGQAIGMFGVVQDISERKQLEQSLHDSEARFRGLMEQAPFSVQVFAPDGRTLRVNRAWEDLWGVTLDQIGEYNILHDQQLAERGVLPLIERAFAGEPTFVPAIRYDPNQTVPGQTRYEDAVRWVAAVAYPLKDDAGVVREVVLVHDDVTARRRAEAALHGSEERLRLALNAGRMGVWDWDVRSGELSWSESLEPLHGLAPGTFSGRIEHFRELIHPEDREAVDAAIRHALASDEVFNIEYRTLWPNGNVHWVGGSGRVFVDDAGEPVRMIGIGLDLTQRKRTEQTARFLADASASLSGLVDFDSTLQKLASLAVPYFADWVAVDVVDPDGEVRRVAVAHVDPAKVELARQIDRRFPRDPERPSAIWRILDSNKPELLREIDDAHLERAGAGEEVRELLHQLGIRSYIGVPLRVRGKTRGVLSFIAAESGHVYDERDLAVAEDLAGRTAIAVENAELYEELRQADRRKDEFLATLAHELRNPLAPIRNGLEILRLTGPQTQMVGEIRSMMERQLDQMVRLVDDLLDVSRITRNRLELRKERTALASVVHNAIESCRPFIEQSGHTLSVTLPPVPVHLDADPVRLAQVLSNLLNNAAKYTEPGGHISLVAEVKGAQAIIRVRDTGLGIPPEALSRIFEMFSQVDRNLPRAQGGLGIGLTLVQRLVEMHGGTVQAKSEGPGHGSEFTVCLPLPAQDKAWFEESDVRAGVPRGPRRRILVVDDNVDAAESLCVMLQLMGNEVRTADDGVAALKVAEEFRPEMILLDIGLPKLSGYEVCRRLRAQPWSQETVIVALTGWGQEEDRRRSDEAGFDHHLVKPVDLRTLGPLLARSKGEPETGERDTSPPEKG